YFIVEMAEARGVPARLIRTARQINEEMPYHVLQLIKDALNDTGVNIGDSNIGILGVAYKGNVADTRETPSKPLIDALLQEGAHVVVHDPYVKKEIIKAMGAEPVTLKEALRCDCTVLMTDHDEYRSIEPNMIQGKVFICARPILQPEKFKKKGIIFRGVGRP
ncbi:MAG: nucleotide sugar dehydrogenase, partial [Methanobacteriaceae archaeon]|nr:nucleotide sugar dehydrogenase [Methanobacteriaceae archaeon]